MAENHTSVELHIKDDTPLTNAISSWGIYLEDQGKSIHTVKAFMSDLQMLADFVPMGATISTITLEDLNSFLQWLQQGRGSPCSPKSFARRITSIKSFFRWLQSNGRISSNPAEDVIQHSVISPMPEILSEEEQALLIQTASNIKFQGQIDLRYATLFLLLLTTGIKKGECLSLLTNHVVLDDPKMPFLFVRYAKPSDRYKERKITLSTKWTELYRQYLDQYKPIDKMFPWSPRRLEYLLEDLGKAAGLKKHLSFDMCRWTCGLNDWKSNMEVDQIRQKLGVSKIQFREISMKLRKLAEAKSD